MNFAYFNQHGDITSVTSIANMDGDYIEVPVNTVPSDWWIDPVTQTLHPRESHEWPEMVIASEGLPIPALDYCAVFVSGVKQEPGSVFVPPAPGCYLVQMVGRKSGTRTVDFVDYAAQRRAAYPSIVDQLDTLYHQGYDAWRAEIEAVKDTYPKA